MSKGDKCNRLYLQEIRYEYDGAEDEAELLHHALELVCEDLEDEIGTRGLINDTPYLLPTEPAFYLGRAYEQLYARRVYKERCRGVPLAIRTGSRERVFKSVRGGN